MDLYVQLAANTIDRYIRKREVYKPSVEELTPEMASSRAGAFVSIHEKGVRLYRFEVIRHER